MRTGFLPIIAMFLVVLRSMSAFADQAPYSPAKNDVVEMQAAAEQGDANAQLRLGVLYLDGKGVPQDDKEALWWFRQAATQDMPVAQLYLGVSGSRVSQ